MNDFDLFNNLSNKYENDNKHKKPFYTSCQHLDTSIENGTIICADCGEEISKHIAHDKEWRYYASTDGKKTSDPNRVHARKLDEKNIAKDLEHLSISDSIITKANEFYTQCTNGQIYRGGSRKAVIFACVYHAYNVSGNHQTPDSLIQAFGITRKAGLKGLKIVNVNISKDSEIHNAEITLHHIISDIMDKFTCTEEQKSEVYNIYDRIKNRSTKLNRARPQSVAASVIYYWVTTNNKDIDIKDFAKITSLSELTITKNLKEIDNIVKKL